jgi:hypothetical protein
MNSGEEFWQGQKGDLFSDGSTDSDKSDDQVEVDLQEKGGTKAIILAGSSAEAGLHEGFCADTFSCQPLVDVTVGEKLQNSQDMGGQVVGFPKVDGVEVLGCYENCGALVSVPTDGDGDVSCTEEREDGLGCLNSNSGQLVEGGVHMESGAVPSSWNPFVDPKEFMGPDFLGLGSEGDRVESTPVLEEVGARDLEGGFIKDTNYLCDGVKGVCSDLSSPASREVINVKIANKKALKKQTSKFPTLPLVGAPLSRMIAMSPRPACRRKKAGEGSKKVVQKGQIEDGVAIPVRPNSPVQREERQAFELQVVLPFPDSGINILLDQNEEEGRISEGEEVAKLMGIQKRVGFTFEGREQLVKEKLVDLEKVDRIQNGTRVSEMGF